MALQDLNFKMISPQTIASYSMANILAALKTALDEVTYSDGSTRTPGSGSAWTYETELDGSDIVSVRMYPPTTSGALRQAVILSGVDAGSPTPTMYGSNTFAADTLLLAHCLNVPNPPVWNGWDHATPITDADFTGYSRASGTLSTVTKLWVFESQESIVIVLGVTNTTAYLLAAGALVDPDSTDANDAESDGRIYGAASCTTTLSTSVHTALGSTSGALFKSSSSANNNNFIVWEPAIGSPIQVCAFGSGLALTAANVAQASGRMRVLEDLVGVGTTSASGKALGRLRGIYRALPAMIGTALTDSGGDRRGYFVSGSETTLVQAFMLNCVP